MTAFALPRPASTFRWAWVPLLLLAYFLRLHHLDFESFWIDEGSSLDSTTRLLQDLSLLVRPDENNTTFWLILGVWVHGAGASDYSLRYASLLFGLPLVPLVHAVGTRLVGRAAAWVVGVLAAGSGFLIYYAQEARTYSFLALLSLVALYLLLRGIEAPGAWYWWAGYAVAALTIVGTHVFGALAVASQGTYVAGRLPRRLGRRGWLPVACTAGVLLPPLLWRASLVPFPPQWRAGGELLLPELARRTTGDLVSWLAFPADGAAALAWPLPYVALIAGLVGMARSGTTARQAAWTAATLLALPLAARSLLLAQVPILSAHRYLIFVVPVFLLVAAAGVAWLGRRWRVAGGTCVIALLLISLAPWWRTHVDGERTKEDWREAVRAIEVTLQDGDIGVFPERQTHAAYAHYGRRALTPITLEGMPAPPAEADLERLLGPYVNSGRQLVAVSHLPLLTLPAELEDWLHTRALKVEELHVPGLTLSRYRLETYPQYEPDPTQRPAVADFSGNVSLLGFERLSAPEAPESLRVALQWQARGLVAHPIQMSLLLEDSDGEVWAASHGPPTHDFYPVTSWQAWQILRDEWEMALLPGTPTGPYTLRVGLRRADTEEVLPVLDAEGVPVGAFVDLGSVALNASWRGSAPPASAHQVLGPTQAGPRLDAVMLPEAPVRPGQLIPLTTFWRLGGPFPDLRLSVEFRTADGQEFTSPRFARLRAPGDAVDGLLLAHRSRFQLPAELPAGSTDIVLRLSDLGGEPIPFSTGWPTMSQPSLLLGSLETISRPAPAPIPPQATRLDEAWGDSISLAAFTMDPVDEIWPGGSLTVTLYWEASGTPEGSYTAFVHLLDAGGRLVAQHDGPPADGAAPTAGWLPGRTIADVHRVDLPAGLEPGAYTAVVGLYEAASDRRLVRPAGDDSFALGQIEVR